ncbi:hypothetical protein G9A89_013370 [Geosiphon pyriformis]|nr:hypothetical protein G9A89_013370 [Geosiphon pyriformis]
MLDRVLICNNSHSKLITKKDPRTPMSTVCQGYYKPNLGPMNTLTYQQLHQYLLTLCFKKILSQQKQNTIQKQAQNYFIQNNQLYHREQQNHTTLQQLIKDSEKEAILYSMHSDPTAEHFNKDTTLERTTNLYYWLMMYKDIFEYVCNCNSCQQRERARIMEPL